MSRTENQVVDLSQPVIMNTHIFPFYYNPSPYKEYWPSFGGDAIQEYIVRKNKLSIGGIKLLASMYKTVIPLRDPLASLLTRENRAPNLRHFCIVDAYVELARQLDGHPNVFFLPVDVHTEYENRKTLLINAVNHCGIDANQHEDVIEKTAQEWQKENITPNNRYHEHYDAGNIDKIQEKIEFQPHLKIPNKYVIGIWHNRSTILRKAKRIDYGLELILFDYTSLMLLNNKSLRTSSFARHKLEAPLAVLNRKKGNTCGHKKAHGSIWFVNLVSSFL